jgi:restriction system protein
MRRLEKIVPPTPFENTSYPNYPKSRRYEPVVRFATIGAVKAGWLVKSKGKWYLTDEGKEAYQTFRDPEQFHRESGRLYHQWADSRPDNTAEDEDIEEIAEEKSLVADVAPSVSTAFEEAEETAWIEVEHHLTAIPPYEFQSLVASLLRAMGYYVSWEAPPGRDKGIDILAHTDPLGTSVPRIKVQVKRRTDKTTAEGLRAFMAVLGEHDVGIYVSAGGFTSEAEGEARTQEKRKITLVDLERLFDLWVLHYEKLTEAAKHLLPLRPVYYLAP